MTEPISDEELMMLDQSGKYPRLIARIDLERNRADAYEEKWRHAEAELVHARRHEGLANDRAALAEDWGRGCESYRKDAETEVARLRSALVTAKTELARTLAPKPKEPTSDE